MAKFFSGRKGTYMSRDRKSSGFSWAAQQNVAERRILGSMSWSAGLSFPAALTVQPHSSRFVRRNATLHREQGRTDRQTDRQTGRQTDRQKTDRETDWQADRQAVPSLSVCLPVGVCLFPTCPCLSVDWILFSCPLSV